MEFRISEFLEKKILAGKQPNPSSKILFFSIFRGSGDSMVLAGFF